MKSTLNFEHFEQKVEPHSRFISEIRDCEKRGYLNVLKVSFWNTLQQLTC